ncbi:MAG: hypothetical protein ACD_42C00563G0002 [uncultured bacterium]|nr:MAG: hypothetical protein ACD_42C00563G0002 [uncultured bacterium]OGT26230.1 MAG: hypothetical protein A3B71_06895 [Gammaproteobacteria bacterium RIFCSPHIGHO2_02_FULL_42_43]OGT29232.1 MAG: hypothetical protein A2624_05365 [Gammaproteobacteria bacterium RIFCSPHIGHO2_01_FULL_42_8]OGT52607.1 MAG: hypothetical protein A3E54_06495 [Gammaproteobacteria bacterium RIFCSPHIGHO2_12_FULL_41_25]OGT63205.1 MAG: hypothetical protein A3I77_06300 [Gammaproteobacteria bacterium RIFCSPLOWO2_02_FULL_42_14]OGT
MPVEISTITENNLVTYEIPLNESIRICLQLENLFHQFDKTAQCTSIHGTKSAMNSLLKMIDVTDRPDLKSKLSQTLTQYTNTFHQFTRSAQVDAKRLQTTLKELESLNHYLHTNHARIGDMLRQNDFLHQIQSHLANPGGVCDFRLPAYTLWQNKTASEKAKDLAEWMAAFEPLRNISKLVLQVTRESAPLETIQALNGFYLQPLNPLTPCQMVRVLLPTQSNLYPEFGAGKHRVTIRFLKPSYFGAGRSTQTQDTVQFQLAVCRI